MKADLKKAPKQLNRRAASIQNKINDAAAGFSDNRGSTALQMQQMDGIADSPFAVTQREQISQAFGNSIQKVEDADLPPRLQQGRALQLKGVESRRRGLSPTTAIQMKIEGMPTIEMGDKLQHGALIEEFTADTQPKSIQVPDGPGWFTRQKDEGLKHGGTPFNLHVPLTRLPNAGKIYVHKLEAAKDLGIITFENHEDAKTKLTEDHLNDEFGSLRYSPSFKQAVTLTKGLYEKKLPASNTENMADIVLEQSEDSGKEGYRYKEDLVRNEPEVVIHETEGNITASDIVQYSVSDWEEENESFSRTIESADHQDKYKQVSQDKSPKAKFGKVS